MESDFTAELLSGFDAARWSVACRHMQLRIVHGNIEAAIAVLRAFFRFTGYELATEQSPLASVLPVRIANTLEDAGYLTVASVARATNADLREIPNIGGEAISTIRSMQQSVASGGRLVQFEEDEELLDESLYLTPELYQRFTDAMNRKRLTVEKTPVAIDKPPEKTTEKPMTDAERVLAALDTLSDSPDTTVEVIDKHIAELDVQIERYKRLRKMLIGSSLKGKPIKPTALLKKCCDAMVKILSAKGPLKPAAIANELADGTTYITVGRAASSDRRFIRRTDGVIELRS